MIKKIVTIKKTNLIYFQISIIYLKIQLINLKPNIEIPLYENA